MRTLMISCLALAIAAGCTRQAEVTRPQEPSAGAKADGGAVAREADAAAAHASKLDALRANAQRQQALPAVVEMRMPPPPPAPPAPASVAYAPLPSSALVQPSPEPNTENYAAFEDNGVVRTSEARKFIAKVGEKGTTSLV